MSKQSEAWAKWYNKGEGFPQVEGCTRETPASGCGSGLRYTQAVRAALPDLFQRYSIRSMLDVPCGDWNWMREVDLTGVAYEGWDVVSEQIVMNRKDFPGICFEVRDVFSALLPKVDLVLCRDLFLHLSNEQISLVLENVRVSDSRWFLASNYPKVLKNVDTSRPIGCRGVNLCEEPFNLPWPIKVIQEDFSRTQPAKTLSLFDIRGMQWPKMM